MKGLKRIHIMIPAFAVVFLLIAAGSANALDPCPAPGNRTITESCEVTYDYTLLPGQYGYKIDADNVLIDGQGFTITGAVTNAYCTGAIGSRTCDICGIRIEHKDGIVIKNLNIEKFCTGIAIEHANNITIDNCEIYDNGFNTQFGGEGMTTHGIHAHHIGTGTSSTPALTIVNSKIYDNKGTGACCGNGGNGIFIYAGGGLEAECANISYNELYGNAKAGFWTKMKLSYSNISNNHAYNNGGGTGITDTVQGGIILRCKMTNNNTVENNNASNNLGCGLYIGGDGNTVRYNKANKSEDQGIHLGRSDGSSYNTINYNKVCWNDKSGIKIEGNTQGNTLYNNTVCHNAHAGTGADIWDNSNVATGDENRCDTAHQYCDNGAGCPPMCDYQCFNIPGPDLKITSKHEEWDTVGSTYYITFTVTNIGIPPGTANPSTASITIDAAAPILISVPLLVPGASFTNTSGPYNITGTNDTIEVCADINNNVTETCETNNCSENVFGGPDYVITIFNEVWLNLSKKTYNLTYIVKNVGDVGVPETTVCRTNFTELNGEWSGCIDPVNVPGLPVGGTMNHTVGPFIMGQPTDWLEAWVNYEHVFGENVIDDLHGNRARFVLNYSGPCLGCGDVDCTGIPLNTGDVFDVYRAISVGAPLICSWAADVDCTGIPLNTGDVFGIYRAISIGASLNCCEGCELW